MSYRAVGLVVSLAVIIGCGTSVGGDDDAVDAGTPDASASCIEAASHSDLEWIQDEIFTRSCSGFTSCHKGSASSAAGLNLEAGMTEANVVNMPALSEPAALDDWLLVVPGDPANSYLMVLIDHDSKGGRFSGPLPEAGTMPYNNPLLCLEKRQAVERWINSLQ